MKAPVTHHDFAVAAFVSLLFFTFNAFAQIPDNVLVNNPDADVTNRDTQSGTAIVRGSGNTVIVAFTDSGSFLGSSNHFVGWARSTDGGSSFADQGTLPNSPAGDVGGASLARDTQTGTIYLSALGFSTVGLNVFRSTDNGLTFLSPPTQVVVSNIDTSSLAVDNFPGTGQGSVYAAWREFAPVNAIRFAKSTNGGASFLPPVDVQTATGTNPSIAVASDHSIYIAYLDEVLPKSIKIRKSTNLGASFGPPVTVAGVTAGPNGDLGLGFNTRAFPKLAINPVSGSLYIVYADKGPGSDRADIYFTYSNDGGITWSPRARVNNDSTTNDQFGPVVAVTPNGTRLFTGFYDRRRDPENNMIDIYGMLADASGATVTPTRNFRISTEAFPAVFGQDPAVNSTYMGTNDAATADNNFFYYPWGDNRLGNSFHPGGQPDVRMAKIPVGGFDYAELTPENISIIGSYNDHALNPDECNILRVGLRNTGNLPLTNVNATISSSDPEVTVFQPTSAYPILDIDTITTNTQPFLITTLPAYPCYRAADFTMNITSDQGELSFPVTVPGTAAGAITEVDSFTNSTQTPIPDVSTVISTIGVFGVTNPVIKATVRLHITHTFDGDLEIQLVSPEGITVMLVADRGGAGDNFGTGCLPETNMTLFDDDAATPVSAGIAPFSGSFRPESPLSAVRGTPAAIANGTWQLVIRDDAGADVGTLQCWSLQLFSGPCDEGTGPCGPNAAKNWMLFD